VKIQRRILQRRQIQIRTGCHSCIWCTTSACGIRDLLKKHLDHLLAIRQSDFNSLFKHVAHDITCAHVPPSSLRLHYVTHDATGEPQTKRVAEMIANYITHYCFSAKRRSGLNEAQRNATYREAKRLFRPSADSGQAGELLAYIFIEAVLEAPQVLQKMPITTNPNDERKGSDGIHMRWHDTDAVLELIFAESKIWGSFAGALRDAFASMETFHQSITKDLELTIYSPFFLDLDELFRERIMSYMQGDNIDKTRQRQACLIGYDWDEYAALQDPQKRLAFVKLFEDKYKLWASETMSPLLQRRLGRFSHKYLLFDFLFCPVQKR
jgi:hypothetical protein